MHEEKQLDIELDEYVPDISSAAVIVSDDKHLDRVETTLGNSSKRIYKAISQDDYNELKDAASRFRCEVPKAVESEAKPTQVPRDGIPGLVGPAYSQRRRRPFLRRTRPYRLSPRGVIATLRRVSLMVSSIRGFVEAFR